MKPEAQRIAIEPGKWYYIDYGYDVVCGRCSVLFPDRKCGIFWFRWGNPYRTPQLVYNSRVFGPAEDPRILVRFLKVLGLWREE